MQKYRIKVPRRVASDSSAPDWSCTCALYCWWSGNLAVIRRYPRGYHLMTKYPSGVISASRTCNQAASFLKAVESTVLLRLWGSPFHSLIDLEEKAVIEGRLSFRNVAAPLDTDLGARLIVAVLYIGSGAASCRIWCTRQISEYLIRLSKLNILYFSNMLQWW